MQQRSADSRLAASGFTDKPQGLAGFNLKAHPVHRFQQGRLHEACPDREMLLQVLHFHEVSAV